jgi:hypothetical protein
MIVLLAHHHKQYQHGGSANVRKRSKVTTDGGPEERPSQTADLFQLKSIMRSHPKVQHMQQQKKHIIAWCPSP